MRLAARGHGHSLKSRYRWRAATGLMRPFNRVPISLGVADLIAWTNECKGTGTPTRVAGVSITWRYMPKTDVIQIVTIATD